MDPNLRSTIQINTFYYFLISVSFAIITQLITMLAVVFGDIAGKEHVVAAPLIVITLLTSFGMVRMMLNLRLIISDMDDKMKSSNYGNAMQSIPFPILKILFAIIFVIIALIQLSSIY